KNAAVMTGVPTRGTDFGTRFAIAGQSDIDPSERPNAALQMVTPGYVDTLGIRVTRGRAIDERDTAGGQRVAMVNEYLADRFFSAVDPLSQRLLVEEFVPGVGRGKAVEWQIVGVFKTVRGVGSQSDYPEIDVPFW